MTQAIRFLSVPPGDLVYHLVVLFAIEAMLAMTWRHRGDGLARRWAIASVGLTAGRLLLILAAALAALKIIPTPVAITPPLERCVEIVSLGLLAWAFLPLLQDHPRAGKVMVIGNLIAAAVVYAWAAPQWFVVSGQGVPFNITAQNTLWSVWALALSLLAVLLSLARRREGWALSLVAFAILAAGHTLHLLSSDPQLYAPEWARLGALAAYPLFTALVYNRLAVREVTAVPVPQIPLVMEPSPASPDLWPVAEACRAVAEASDLPRALQQAAGAIARAINADLVAVGVPGASPDTVELAAIHHPGTTPEVGAVFPLDSQPTIKRVISAKREATLDPLRAQGNEAATLAQLLDTPSAQPLLIEPLVHNRETVGVLIMSQAHRNAVEPDSNGYGRAAQTAAAQLGWALGMARRAETLARRAEELAVSLRHQETRATQNRLALEAQAAASQAELQVVRSHLEAARSQAAQHQKRAEEIAALVDQLQIEREQATSHDGQEQIERLKADRAQAAAEAEEWKRQAESLMAVQAALQEELNRAKVQSTSSPEQTDQYERTAVPLSADGACYGILVSDARGQVVAASNAATQLLGLSRRALIGQPLAGVCADPTWNKTIQSLMAPPNGSAPAPSPTRFTAQMGSHALDVELAALAANDSAPGGVVAVLTAPNGKEEAENHNEVIASLAQELRTPMTSISGYTDLLLGESVGILGAMQRQFLQRVKANIERMNGMLNDLVRVTAIDTEHFELEPEPVNLREIIEETIMGSSAQFHEHDITIQLDLAEQLPSLHADRDSLYQIMSHLLANACLCSKPGTQVGVSAQRSEAEGFVAVSVTDTGNGISLADRQRVFSRHYRADNPLIEGLGDTGIGLSIAKTLVEAHGGRIWVDSEMGKGSTFTFLLRAVQPA